MSKDLKVAELLDTYGSILNDKQRLAMEYYYYEDYSLSEISQNFGVSRQGINDLIKRSKAMLYSCEENLGIIKRRQNCLKKLQEIKNNFDNPKLLKQIQELENYLKEI